MSAMPLCGDSEKAVTDWRGGASFAKIFLKLIGLCYVRILEDSVVALLSQVGVFLVLVGFAEGQWGKRRRLLWGVTFGCVHPLMAVAIACLLDLAFTIIGNEATKPVEPPMLLRNLPPPWDDTGIWMAQAAIRFLDLPTHTANARAAVCASGPSSPSRSLYVTYVALVLPYFWILA